MNENVLRLQISVYYRKAGGENLSNTEEEDWLQTDVQRVNVIQAAGNLL
jgi:hypothetical protein